MIYRNRENLRYCKGLGIRLTGPRLGRPTMDIAKQKAIKQIERQDSGTRNAVEGKFGKGKLAYGLNYIRGKLRETSETMIMFKFVQ